MKRLWREEAKRELRGERVEASKRRESRVAMRAILLSQSIRAKTNKATNNKEGKTEAVISTRRREEQAGYDKKTLTMAKVTTW